MDTDAGVSLLVDHARRDVAYVPRHCACPGCRLWHSHIPAVSR